MTAETRLEELKRYVRFGERDAELLREFKKFAAPHFPRIAREFYDRTREHEQAHDVFTGEEQIQRLQRTLVTWMERVCGGQYDEAYSVETAHIGRVHVRIGLPQRYMLMAMALIRVSLLRIADSALGNEAAATREAIVRVLDIELALMLESYQEATLARMQNVERLEKHELGQALARAEHRYANAVELAHVVIVGMDGERNIQLFNREAERITGFARDEVLNSDFLETLVSEDSREEIESVFAELFAGKVETRVVQGVLRTRAGKLRDVIWNFTYAPSIETNDDVVLYAMGRDVTDALAMSERTRQAEKLAAIGTLAAGLAHEIRNPLNGALLHVSFLERAIRKSSNDTDMLAAVHVVADEIKRLANLVSEFLDFARPKPLELRTVSLLRTSEHAAAMLKPLAAEAQVTLLTDLPTADVEFDADPGRLEQVLLNLLRNAIEALQPSGGGRVVLRGRRTPRQVILEIEDDGPGLSNPDAPIFDAFFSTKEGGTGLGLAIAHRIATDHRGTIDVSSGHGKTIFRLTLPLRSSGAGESL